MAQFQGRIVWEGMERTMIPDEIVIRNTHVGLLRFDVLPRDVDTHQVLFPRVYELPGGPYTWRTIELPVCQRMGWDKDMDPLATCDATSGEGRHMKHEIKFSYSQRIYINHVSWRQLLETARSFGSIAVYNQYYGKLFVWEAARIDWAYRWRRVYQKDNGLTRTLCWDYASVYEAPVQVEDAEAKRLRLEAEAAKRSEIAFAFCPESADEIKKKRIDARHHKIQVAKKSSIVDKKYKTLMSRVEGYSAEEQQLQEMRWRERYQRLNPVRLHPFAPRPRPEQVTQLTPQSSREYELFVEREERESKKKRKK